MLNQTERGAEYKARFIAFFQTEYGKNVLALQPAKRGFYGETWKLDTSGGSCFVKMVSSPSHKRLYEHSFSVVEHVNRQGVDCISNIIKTASGALYTHFDGAAVGVFDWIDGENVQDERTKLAEYQILAKVYAIPTDGLPLLREMFDAESLRLFYRQWQELKQRSSNPNSQVLLHLFDRHNDKLEALADRLMSLSARCKGDIAPKFITHGDAGGNVIAGENHFSLVDWDDPLLAPPERDAWFCLHWDWAMDAFHEALRAQNIDYRLRPERLAYYCYHAFFWYLTKYLDVWLESGDASGELTAEISDYIPNSWVHENIAYAGEHLS